MHVIAQAAEQMLDKAVADFKRDPSGMYWVMLRVAMMRFQQARNMTDDDALTAIDELLLVRCGAKSWAEMLREFDRGDE